MKPPKESKQARIQRMEETEGGRRFRSKVWSANGDRKNTKTDRMSAKLNLRKGNYDG